ncbi:MAG: hypothetical protein IJ740_02105 [Ruminococcus sp.]|nr:hypothetical protein [Ruminococcus sp.]
MTILIDDIKFNNENEFFFLVNESFKDKEILDLDSFYNVLTENNPEIEIILSDFDTVEESSKPFASKVYKMLHEVKAVNPNFTLTMFG